MELKMLTGLGGPDVSLTRGDPHTCDDFEAVRLVRAGFADPVDMEAYAAAEAAFDAAFSAEKPESSEPAADAVQAGAEGVEPAKAPADGAPAEDAPVTAEGEAVAKAKPAAKAKAKG